MPQLATSSVPTGFTETAAHANGIIVNYVRGGSGPVAIQDSRGLNGSSLVGAVGVSA